MTPFLNSGNLRERCENPPTIEAFVHTVKNYRECCSTLLGASMFCNRRIFCKNYVIFVVILILLLAGILAWIANARLEAFHKYHHDLSHESVGGVERQVAFYVAEKRRTVAQFAQDHFKLIHNLASHPNNDKLHAKLSKTLTRHFPDHFAFSVANKSGTPLFEDFDGLIGELCLSDIKKFSTAKQSYHPYIHPNIEHYHFDIMVRYGKNGEEGVFFVSFLADVLGNIINSIQSPGHRIMLIQPQREDIIEVVAEGARNKIDRDDYRLSAEERSNISMRHNVKGTNWQAIDFHDTKLHARYRNKLIVESCIIFLVFVTIALLLVIRLVREERHRELAEEQKKALMAMVTHEFRSPVAVIKTSLDLVLGGSLGKISVDTKEFLDIGLNSTSQLLLLVDDFIDIQKLESGNLKFNMQESQLSHVVTDIVSNNKLYAKRFSCHYELKEPLANDLVLIDKRRIGQVLTNILTNAAKYGGEKDTIKVSVTRIGKQLRVSVSDHGAGIPQKFQSHVFEQFAMAYVPQKDQTVNSSGLGLTIAKAIIEQHGGTIGFDTDTDTQSGTSGTTFWFELPIL